MSRRQSFLAHLALLLGVVAFTSSFARPTSAQFGNVAPQVSGRYQATCAVSTNRADYYVIDTQTGHSWRRDDDGWVDLGAPPIK